MSFPFTLSPTRFRRIQPVHLALLIGGLLTIEVPLIVSLWGDDLASWKRHYIDAPDPVMVLLERRTAPATQASSDDGQQRVAGKATTNGPSPSIEAAASGPLHRAAAPASALTPNQYRLLGFTSEEPRRVTFDVASRHCSYRLGDRLPGWGSIVALTDRSVTILINSPPYFDRRVQFPRSTIVVPQGRPSEDFCTIKSR